MPETLVENFSKFTTNQSIFENHSPSRHISLLFLSYDSSFSVIYTQVRKLHSSRIIENTMWSQCCT